MKTDVFVIGGGAAGLAAAAKAAERGAHVVLAEPFGLGGRMLTHIECGVGGMTGPELAARLVSGMRASGRVRVLRTAVVRVSPDKTVETAGGDGSFVCTAGAVVLACGGRDVPLSGTGTPFPAGIDGIFTASEALTAHCLFGKRIGRRAVVIGAGGEGLTVARRLALEGTTVVGVTETASSPRASALSVRDCIDDLRIPLYLSARVLSVKGGDRVESVRVSSGSDEFILRCDAVVCAAGRLPDCSLYPFAEVCASGIPAVDSAFMTGSAGFFIAGGALHSCGSPGGTSLSDGSAAGRAAAAYALGGERIRASYSLTAGKGIGYVVPSRFAVGSEFRAAVRPSADIPSGYVIMRSPSGELLFRSNRTALCSGRETLICVPSEAACGDLIVSAEAI